MKTIDRITATHLLAFLIAISTVGLFYVIILKGIGGSEALFAILGYVAGWMSSIVIYLYPKNKNGGDNTNAST